MNEENNIPKIFVRGGFSERKGLLKYSDIVQVNTLNIRTRNKLYNVFCELFRTDDRDFKEGMIEYIFSEILSYAIDDIPINEFGMGFDYGRIFQMIKEIYENSNYNEVFDFIQGIINGMRHINYYAYNIKLFVESINRVFFMENVNYRIINEIITDIVNEDEIQSINDSLNNRNGTVNKHFKKAVEKLYIDHDYANSIKESISAVEAMCQTINKSKETLNKALEKLKIDIHPALKEAYIKLYAYSCDAEGIRHSNGIGEGEVLFSEAKYMLISCSAFINYLQENYDES